MLWYIVLPSYLFHISIKWNSKCSVNVFLIFWKDSERFSMFSYVVSIILMWPIFYLFMGNVKNIFYCYYLRAPSELRGKSIFQWNGTTWCGVSGFQKLGAICCKYLFCKLEAGYLSLVLLQLLCEQAVAFVNLFSNNLMLCCSGKILQLSNLRSILSAQGSWYLI